VVLGNMQLMRRLVVVGGLALVLLAVTVEGGGADTAARVVDRTFACAPKAFNGVGDVDVNANPPADYGIYEQSALLAVRTGSINPTGSLVFVRTRPEERLGGWRSGPAGVYANARRCRPLRTRLALSRRGLAGPPAQWYKDVDCRVRGRVVVRVRSVLTGDATWGRIDRNFEGARQPVEQSKVAVRSERTGKAIAYMEHDARGAVKLWYSGACS
jgi:hypothetical protein